MSKRKTIPAFVVTMIILLPSIGIAAESHRDGLFQIGVGAGFPSYPSEVEAVFSYIDSAPGVERVKVAFDIAAGLAITQQAFLIFRADGTGDRFEYENEYAQVNLILYSIGARYYPSTTGIYCEGGFGASRGVTQTSYSGDSASDFGTGFDAAIGYDFAAKPKGFGVTIEAKYNALRIEDEEFGAVLLTLNLCWK